MITGIVLALCTMAAPIAAPILAQARLPKPLPFLSNNSIDFQTAKPLAKVRFLYSQQHIFVTVAVNGQHGMVFLLDSGSTKNGFNLHTAEAFHIKPRSIKSLMDLGLGEGSTYVASSVKATVDIGSLNLKENLLIVDMSGLEHAADHRIDGILGFPLFEHYVVKLDFKKHILSIFPPGDYRYPDADYVIPATVKDHVPVVTCRLQFAKKKEFDATVEVDTGSDDTMLVYRQFEIKHHLKRLAPRQEVEKAYGLGGEYLVMRANIDSVYVGTLKASQPRIGFSTATRGVSARSGIDGEVGNAFLEKSNRLIFDIPHDQILFELKQPAADATVSDTALVRKN
ncbi:MAG TPA: retropepsin-like aspartic protease [Acidobacteriaceae bacterium]|jgi:hypothetical protein|nr:retropepsin-like aspartic protease [Acidobacteriaceae bacterium]